VAEIIAGYALHSRAYEAVLPFGIAWQNGRYTLTSLTPCPPQLTSRKLDPTTTKYRHDVYLTPLTIKTGITDRFQNIALTGCRAQAFALTQQSNPRLLTGYGTSPPSSTSTVVFELHASQILFGGTLKLQACTPTYFACRAPPREQDVIVPPDLDPNSALLAPRGTVGNKWEGRVIVTSPSTCAVRRSLHMSAVAADRARALVRLLADQPTRRAMHALRSRGTERGPPGRRAVRQSDERRV
jgi:hypothetical protein